MTTLLPTAGPVLDFLDRRTHVHLALARCRVPPPPLEKYVLPCEGLLVEFGLYVGLKAYGYDDSASHLEKDQLPVDEEARARMALEHLFMKYTWLELGRRNFYCVDLQAAMDEFKKRGYRVACVADLGLATERYMIADESKRPVEFMYVYAHPPDMAAYGWYPQMRWTYDGTSYTCHDASGQLTKTRLNQIACLTIETLAVMSTSAAQPVDVYVAAVVASIKGLLEFQWGLLEDAPYLFFKRIRDAHDHLVRLPHHN